ncbi:MAG TPA: hypothetical protein VMV46_21735 [Thermoanaerobaculia bacterium]|nr:hypothetical protein [Thermoanaerobaculia bacterium]
MRHAASGAPPPRIPTAVVAGIAPDPRSSRAIERELHALIEGGAEIHCAGDAQDDPLRLLALGYTPKARIDLFDTRFYFTHARQNPDLRFMVAYVVQRDPASGVLAIHPRIVYKDISLIWRTASHLFWHGDDMWIGKGDTRIERRGEYLEEESIEATTDLPLEVQDAVESLNRRVRRPRHDVEVLALVLRNSARHRVRPFRDFLEPRRRAAANPRNRIHGGRKVLRFTRRGDPTSLVVAHGYQPDFEGGLIERSAAKSSLYGGTVRRLRLLSKNRRIQYLFLVGPEHAWVVPPQALTTELSSFGVRTVDVVADEEVFVPGYEYHFVEDGPDGLALHSQIPEGYVGALHQHDDTRADASAWLDRLPIIEELRAALARGMV